MSFVCDPLSPPSSSRTSSRPLRPKYTRYPGPKSNRAVFDVLANDERHARLLSPRIIKSRTPVGDHGLVAADFLLLHRVERFRRSSDLAQPSCSSRRSPISRMAFRKHVISLAALAYLLACQASPSPANQLQVPRVSSAPTPCDDQVAGFSADADQLFRGDFLYSCRLEQAYRDLVAPRRACSTAADCVLVSGTNVLPGVFINRRYVEHVSTVRDKTSEAEGFVVTKRHCGGVGPKPEADCIDGLCQAKLADYSSTSSGSLSTMNSAPSSSGAR